MPDPKLSPLALPYGTCASTNQMTSRLRGWDGWNTDSIELHLQTRFAQLEVAAGLELWTEGFRTVEDIYNIMQVRQRVVRRDSVWPGYVHATRHHVWRVSQ